MYLKELGYERSLRGRHCDRDRSSIWGRPGTLKALWLCPAGRNGVLVWVVCGAGTEGGIEWTTGTSRIGEFLLWMW